MIFHWHRNVCMYERYDAEKISAMLLMMMVMANEHNFALFTIFRTAKYSQHFCRCCVLPRIAIQPHLLILLNQSRGWECFLLFIKLPLFRCRLMHSVLARFVVCEMQSTPKAAEHKFWLQNSEVFFCKCALTSHDLFVSLFPSSFFF